MTEPLVQQLDAEPKTPHLFSHTRIQKYLTCPEQYRLYYVERLRAKVESASLAFGAVMHLALAEHFQRKADPVAVFSREWQALREIAIRYSRKDSWQSLKEKGERLLQKFYRTEAKRIGTVYSVEKVFEFGLSTLSKPFVAIIDLVAEMDGKRTLVEFKTAASSFQDFEVAMLDQVTAYQLADPEVEQVVVCVFLKSKEPKIRWHKTKRTPEQVMEYVEKVEFVANQIERGVFYKRPGKWCRQCEFLPVCLGDQERANETLVRIT